MKKLVSGNVLSKEDNPALAENSNNLDILSFSSAHSSFRMEIMSILLKLIDRDAASVEKGRERSQIVFI